MVHLPKAAEPVVLVASAEFTLKSSAVRRTLEQRLIDDLKYALHREKLEYSRIEKEAARFVLFGIKQPDPAAVICSNVFGVAYAAPAVMLTHSTLSDILQTLTELARHELTPGKSFAIRARRATKSAISRRDVEVEGGSMILTAFKDEVSVDLDEPDLTFYVDLVGDDVFLYSRKLNGPGGLPISAQWKMLAVLDSGPLSIVAALAMMRRGCVVELFIPTSNKNALLSPEKQLAFARKISKLVTRPSYKAFVMEIDDLPLGDQPVNTEWKDFVRASAIKFAQEKRFKGLIFGDISGELSSFNSYSGLGPLPVFYPLLGFEEEDLTELLRLAGLEQRELSSELERTHAPETEVRALFDSLTVPSVREISF